MIELSKVPCKTTYLWDSKETGEIILGTNSQCILNKSASYIWNLIDEKNSIQDIVDNCAQKKIEKEKVIATIHDLEKMGYVSYVTSLWE
ncbi:PqqD family peptide modification chaperone [candidate division KSB1 bacterium]|nr:PqqD family peptide modification chaperone [candidate division KSB1 bacterium]